MTDFSSSNAIPMPIVGALNTKTNNYTFPNKGEKGQDYKCVDCNQKVIFRKGNVRVPHFAHYSATNTCTYFEHQNEGQLHKNAKFKLAQMLKDKRKITLTWQCCSCECIPAGDDIDVEYSDGDKVIVEYRDPAGKYVADIAVLNKDNLIKYIFEIKDTHATTTNTRPEPWFEFSVKGIEGSEESNIECINDGLEDNLNLYCERVCNLRKCNNCKAEEEAWALNLPYLGKKVGGEGAWKQTADCILCGRDQYNPVFIKGFRQICKICLGTEYEELKKRFHKPLCMID